MSDAVLTVLSSKYALSSGIKEFLAERKPNDQ